MTSLPPTVSAIPALARRLFDADVAVAEVDPREIDPEHVLLPAERDAVERAIDTRRMQYAAGRHCAREGMRALGLPPGPVTPDSDRAPRFPPGVVGTITHTQWWAAAAVARDTQRAALGVGALVALDRVLEFAGGQRGGVVGGGAQEFFVPAHGGGIVAAFLDDGGDLCVRLFQRAVVAFTGEFDSGEEAFGDAHLDGRFAAADDHRAVRADAGGEVACLLVEDFWVFVGAQTDVCGEWASRAASSHRFLQLSKSLVESLI